MHPVKVHISDIAIHQVTRLRQCGCICDHRQHPAAGGLHIAAQQQFGVVAAARQVVGEQASLRQTPTIGVPGGAKKLTKSDLEDLFRSDS